MPVRRWCLWFAALIAACIALPALAHDVRPAYLAITLEPGGGYRADWRQPVQGDRVLLLVPHLSTGWLERPPDSESVTGVLRLRTWRGTGAGIDGATVRVDGLEGTITDVLVTVTAPDGNRFETILRPDRREARIALGARGALAVPAYFRLGVEHILAGADHLAFVLGLMLIAGTGRRLALAITGFTLAHSLTLAASALGLVRVDPPTIEALVALSILFVAAEFVRGTRRGLAWRWPVLIALVFGLLHGFAFAGALAQIGLPGEAIPLSLLLFNLGVEAGQLLFVGAILALGWAARRLALPGLDLVPRITGYAIGVFAAFLFIERSAATLG